ncbi:MAG: type II toxin-antitoxin system YafQ family toxin [Blautia sp.]|nr:type II toxin-antitoxin system YafQ family toxin [Blautia sp.]
MLDLIYTGRFKKDLKVCDKRGYDMKQIQNVIATLRIPAELESKHRNHALSGLYSKNQECHITPDWLLIYYYDDDGLHLVRTGTHSDLFK